MSNTVFVLNCDAWIFCNSLSPKLTHSAICRFVIVLYSRHHDTYTETIFMKNEQSLSILSIKSWFTQPVWTACRHVSCNFVLSIDMSSQSTLVDFIKECRLTDCGPDTCWSAMTAYTEFFDILLRWVHKFAQENVCSKHNSSKLENNRLLGFLKKSITLASRSQSTAPSILKLGIFCL